MKTGYFTQQELIKLKLFLDKQQVDSKRLMKLILEDESSAFKQNMVSGKKYYAAEHDILNRQKYYYIEGKRETDVSKSNQKLPHPFLKVLIDQKTAYIVGNPIVVSVAVSDYEDPQKPTPAEEAAKKEAENFQELLLEQLGDSFDDKMNNWILNASKKALEWIHFYIDAEGELQFIIVPAEEIIPVYDTQYQNKLLQIIRYYKVEYYNSEDLEQKEKKYRYKVEIWTETGITYYAQYSDELELALDPDYKVNPAGHWTVLQTSPTSRLSFNR